MKKKLSPLDLAKFQAAAERELRCAAEVETAQVRHQVAQRDRLALAADIKRRYGLGDGDTLDPETGAITRAAPSA
jgi:hypothetical protein